MSDTFRKEYNSVHKLHGFEKEIKVIAENLEAKFKEIGHCRETSLALTNLEQAVMWAVKGLYNYQDGHQLND